MIRSMRTLAALALALGLAGAFASPAHATAASHGVVTDRHGDVQRWNGGDDPRHAGGSIDVYRVGWRVAGHDGRRTLTATLRLRRVWADRGREMESVDVLLRRPGTRRSAVVTAFGPLRHGRPVLETVGRSSDSRRILGCSSLRAVKHPVAHTVVVSLRLSCLPASYRAAGAMLSADSALNEGDTTYWFDPTRAVRVDLR